MPALRTLAFAGGAIVLALTAVIFFLQTKEGSDRPDGRGTGGDAAIMGTAIQLHAPRSPDPTASASDAGTASGGASAGTSEQPPPASAVEDEGEAADQPEPVDSPGPREDRPPEGGGGEDPTDLIDDITDQLPGGGR
jgi:hypothetical protein